MRTAAPRANHVLPDLPDDYRMTIEDKIFMRMRPVPERAEAYGFIKTGTCYELETEFMDGDFGAVIRFGPDGKVSGSVTDRMNDEEFAQLRNPFYNGAYVNTVRAAYEELLRDIAENCFTEVFFASDQSNRLTARICSEYGVRPDFPFEDERYSPCGVFRHQDSGKWFGLIMNIRRRNVDRNAPDEPVDAINLKISEEDAEELHRENGIYPAYHMNHKKWISVLLDDTLPDDRVMELIGESRRLTAGKPGKLSEPLIRKVLDIADSVPYGRVATYGQIAKLAGMEKNARLVGKIMSMADRYGDHPCHRVVNSSGRTVPGWIEQRGMLEAEGVVFKANGCVDMTGFRWEPQGL